MWWAKTREKGIFNFILKFGVILWGLSNAVIYFLISQLRLNKPWGNWQLDLLKIIPVYMLCGIIIGLVMWGQNERLFKKTYK